MPVAKAPKKNDQSSRHLFRVLSFLGFLGSALVGVAIRNQAKMMATIDQHFKYLHPIAQWAEAAPTTMAYAQDSCIVSQRSLTYRYPSPRFEQRHGAIVMGAMSSAKNWKQRRAIRETWARNRTNIFFVVAGNWTDELEEEFLHHQDLFWIDRPETYRGLTYKTLAFLTAVEKHVKGYNYVFKTDDDVCINMEKLEKLLAERYKHADYIGSCKRKAPVLRNDTRKWRKWRVSTKVHPKNVYEDYACGLGYALSDRVLPCMVNGIPETIYLPIEDAATGILASKCNVSCIKPPKGFQTGSKNASKQYVIRWDLKSPKSIRREYARMHLAPVLTNSSQLESTK